MTLRPRGGASFFQEDFYDDYQSYRSTKLPRSFAVEEMADPINRRILLTDMAESSPTTSSFLWTVRQVANQSKWRFNGKIDNDPRTEFLNGVFFRDMNKSWNGFLTCAMTMIIHGYSIFEIVHKLRMGQNKEKKLRSIYNDGKVGLRTIGFRPQSTIWKLKFDEDNELESIEQQISKAKVHITANNLLMFRTSEDKKDGRSVLRGAYSAYFRQQIIEYLESIGIERDLAGFPVIQLLPENDPPDIFAETDTAKKLRIRLQEIVTTVRRDQNEGAVMPAWAELKLVSSQGGRSLDIKASLERYDVRILQALMADFLQLGVSTASGSYALGASRQSLFYVAIKGFMDIIADKINIQLVPDILALNNMKTDDHPVLAVSELEPRNLGVLGSFIESLANAGIPAKPTKQLQSQLSDATKVNIEFDAERIKKDRENETTASNKDNRQTGNLDEGKKKNNDNGDNKED